MQTKLRDTHTHTVCAGIPLHSIELVRGRPNAMKKILVTTFSMPLIWVIYYHEGNEATKEQQPEKKKTNKQTSNTISNKASTRPIEMDTNNKHTKRNTTSQDKIYRYILD